MKKTISFLSVLLFIYCSSCHKDFLEKTPLDQYGETIVWSDLALMENFVNNIYTQIGISLDRPMMSVICDEAMMNTNYGGTSNITNSLISPSDYSFFDTWGGRQRTNTWKYIYLSIRACNLFLENVEKHTYPDEAMKNRLMGEVYFLRAYRYHTLVFMYGGFPIITKAYNLKDDFNISRNTFEECINFIVDDCDKAADLLPLSQSTKNFGRATKGAALALKSRVLLYAASDLYHNTSWANGYSNPKLIGYAGTASRESYWQAAKDAAKAVMDLNVYDLYKKNPAPGEAIDQNYQEIFTSKQTIETIFQCNIIAAVGGHNIGRINGPNGYHCWGNANPTNQMVEAFEMSDGEKFDWNNPAHAANPYENREARFYANILFNGAKWRPRPGDVVSMDNVGIIETSYKEQADGSWKGGLDTRASSVDGFNATLTGYYMRKFLDIKVNSPMEIPENPWIFIRYAEVLLNYAEACTELGEEQEARTYTNMLRHRVGLPDINTSGNELRESVRHERKIELMFEDQRYFDIRRWMIAPQAQVDVEGISIKYHLGSTIPTYSIINVQGRDWKDSFYFMPIQLDEMNRNNLLIQNPLY